MSKPFCDAIITAAGAQLLAKVEAGTAAMEITKIVIGEGVYSVEERNPDNLKQRTSLKIPRNTFSPSHVDVVSEDSIKIRVLISNVDPVTGEPLVSAGYFFNELAVYEKENGGESTTECMYCVAITTGDTGDYIPPYEGGGAAQIIQDIYLTVGNAATTYVDIAGAAFLATEGQQLKTDMADLSAGLESLSDDVDEFKAHIETIVGAPLVAALVEDMTDETRVYVYTGSETGYTAGNWYYYDGSAWVSGGVYNAVAVNTDKTLTQEDQPADAKKVGDELTDLKADLNYEQLDLLAGKHIKTNGGTVLPENVADTESSWCCLCVDCNQGDTFVITGQTGETNDRLWAFADSSGTVIDQASNASSATTQKLTAPYGSAYFAFNSRLNANPSVVKGMIAKSEISDMQESLKGSPNILVNKYNFLIRGNVIPTTPYSWEYGGISNATGNANNANTNRLRSDFCSVLANTQYRIVGNGYFMIHQYTNAKSYIGRVSTSWNSPDYTFTTASNARYLKFILKKDDAGTGEFDVTSISNLDLACYPVSNDLDNKLEAVDNLETFSVNTAQKLNKIEAFIDNYPHYDLLNLFADKQDTTNNGVTFTWDAEKRICTVNGTSTGTSSDPSRSVIYNGVLPSCVKTSKLYKFVVEPETTDIQARIRFLDENGDAVFSTGAVSETKIVYGNRLTETLEIRLQTTAGATITNKKIVIRLEEVTETEAPVQIKCCTYNVGCYNYGYPPSVEHPIVATSTILAQMKEYFRTHDMNIFALQEGQNVILDSDLTTETNANLAIYDYLFPYSVTSNTTDRPYSPSLYSKFPAVRTGSSSLSSNRRYAWAILNVEGILVYVLSVHLALDPEDRAVNYEEIKTLVEKYNHWIVLGDFNAGNGVADWDAQPEYTALINNGWHSANGGWWGQFNTYAPSDESAQPRRLDTILTSSNIDINTYDAPYLRSSMPGDHRPLMCDVTIYPDSNN